MIAAQQLQERRLEELLRRQLGTRGFRSAAWHDDERADGGLLAFWDLVEDNDRRGIRFVAIGDILQCLARFDLVVTSQPSG